MSTSDTVADYFSHLRNGAGWESFLADDLVFTSFTTPVKRATGRTAFLQSTKRFYSMIRGLEVCKVIVDGDAACALTRYDLQPPAGPAFQSNVAEVFGIRDGKIASFDIYFDSSPFPKG